MDFLLMALIYTLCFVIISYVLIAGKNDYHRTGWIGFLRRSFLSVVYFAGSVVEKCIPTAVTHRITNITNYVLFTRIYCKVSNPLCGFPTAILMESPDSSKVSISDTIPGLLHLSMRNPFIQLLYGFLITGGTAIYTFKVIPNFDTVNAFSIIEYILIAINVTLFWVCSMKDPGIISTLHHSEYMSDYEPDGVYYLAQECYTCKFVKPARSKHCSICNVCVSRFDHHCSWVNNCIGKKNYKFFLGFITSTAILCTYTTFLVSVVFAYIVISDGLTTMKYEDHDGKQYTVGIRILTQYLLVHYPFLAMLFLTVFSFGLAMSGFSLFHCYLVLTNQTTNEFYKRFFPGKHLTKLSRQTRMKGPRNEATTLKASKRRTSSNKNVSSGTLSKKAEKLDAQRWTSTPYDKGVWQNIAEIIRG